MSNKDIMKANIKLSGMSCTSCALSVEKALKGTTGVIQATVNYANETATVEYDMSLLDNERLIKVIRELGYDAEIVEDNPYIKLSFKVDGMSCVSCAANLQKQLINHKGILQSDVNFALEKLTLIYNPSILKQSDIEQIANKAGFKLSLINDKSDEEAFDKEDDKVITSRKRMIFSSILSGLVMLLMVIHMFIVKIPGYLYITAALAFINIFIIGYKIHKGSFNAIKNKAPNMDVLVSLGSVPPYIIGLVGLFLPGIQTFVEMATTIITFHLIGKYLEIRAKGRASQAITKLINLGAKTARIIIDGREVEVMAKELAKDDIMFIRPGEKIPTDGIIIEGYTLIDESMATGESLPVKRGIDDEVIGATINKQGAIKVKVTKVGKDTFLSQVIKMVEECQGSKVPIQEFADKVTGFFVPMIIGLTVLVFISNLVFPNFHIAIINWGASFLPWVNPGQPTLLRAFITATAVLVISCPCALGLGTPTALMVGSGIGAEKGILIRNGEAVQTLKDVKVIALDKTGTLTIGKPGIVDLIALGVTSEEVLYTAATIENASEHPIAYAIISSAKAKNIELGELTDFKALSGKGVEGLVDNTRVLIGNRNLMADNGINYQGVDSTITHLEDEAKTAMIVARAGKIIGIIGIADPIKPEAAYMVNELKSMGIVTSMITGDNKRTASAIGRNVGIDEIISEVLPEGKVEEVKRLQNMYGVIAMVGDGINDAPALKQANLGIAIGTGTDIAIEASDVTLIKGELGGIITAIKLSWATFKKIKENYFWAWAYNLVAIPIAMLGLLHPMLGAAAMSLSSLNVVYNSLRLRRVNVDPLFQKR